MRTAYLAAFAACGLMLACLDSDPEVGSSDPPPVSSSGGFNAGSGTLQPDGLTIIYRIPDGTGGNDWNPKSNPIRARRGMTVRLIDDDSTADHWLHTYGQPCDHGTQMIGSGFDCVIKPDAPYGISTTAEHNILNGIGYLYIDVVP
jgi:hypothetical protein